MRDLTDFAVQERPEGNLMVAISRPWYNCSYTMAAKPIKSLELHYTMMQFLIITKYPTTQIHGIMIGFLDRLKRERDISIKAMSSGGKMAFR